MMEYSHIIQRIKFSRLVCEILNPTPPLLVLQDTAVLYTRQDFQHYLEAVVGLINIFKEKFYRPPVSCVR